jgi:hypothetical protein
VVDDGNIGTGMVVVCLLLIRGPTNLAEKIAIYPSYYIPERCVSILPGLVW